MLQQLLPIIDHAVFNQLLEMDDDSLHGFSKSIIDSWREQAQDTLWQLQESLKIGDLAKASQLAHFLKGSSAAIGAARLRETCEQMQETGRHKDAVNTSKLLSRAYMEFLEADKAYQEVYMVVPRS
jgi:osomolarity two-component system, phosphorelay intermediate protein YPD1